MGERIKLMGMQKTKELEGKSGEVVSIMQAQGKVRVALDCGKHVLVSVEQVARGHDEQHMNKAEDPTTTQHTQKEDKREGRKGTGSKGQKGQKEEGKEEKEGEKVPKV